MMHIDKETYKISENNRYKTITPKTQIVIGVSLRKENRHIIRLQHTKYYENKNWNTFTISRDGKIYQHYDEKYHTDFLDIKEGDKRSISIVLENMGNLFQMSSRKYINWLNEFCDEKYIIEKEWLGYEYWEKFPNIQIEALISLCNILCKKHGIQKNFIDFNTYHKETYKFKGIVFRSNYIEDSSDINPLLNLIELNKKLNKKN
jgi:N-acetyl-anhydromuramyl-L-alanine amidase AmpD